MKYKKIIFLREGGQTLTQVAQRRISIFGDIKNLIVQGSEQADVTTKLF